MIFQKRQVSKSLLWSFYAFTLIIVACQPETTQTPTSSPIPETLFPTLSPVPKPTGTTPPTASPTVPASVIELEGTELPAGFSIIEFAEVFHPTAFAFDAQGFLYVTSTDGSVYRLADSDRDGRSETQVILAGGYNTPLGVAVHPKTGEVYVSYQGGISVLTDHDGDGNIEKKRTLVSNLPVDLHQNDTLTFGPDGWLYMGLGSTCDACEETDPRSASMLRFNVETEDGEVYATGMRNPYGVAFHPSGALFATDNGRDDLGMDAPHEELNHIVQGGDYGFPDCWDAQDQPGCENTIPAVAHFEPHSSANGLDFYDGDRLPAEYRGNAFVTIFGSWLKPGVQTGIQRVILKEEGNQYTGEASWFARFPEGVMPLPLVFGADNALYVGDYINNTIYRISYGIP